MHFSPRHQEAESLFRKLVRDADLDQPDAVEYRYDEVVFLWHGPKLAVIVELDASSCDDAGSSADSCSQAIPGERH
jgi:hypothetical protein